MKENTRCILSGNIRYLRLKRGWSQEQLAEQCGLHRTYIGAIERCERNIGLDNLERLAKALDVPVSILLIAGCPSRDPEGVHEARMPYGSSPSASRIGIPLHFSRRAAIYQRQCATHSLSTLPVNFPVMATHESKCKEATGTKSTPAAYQSWLVTGGSRRTQRAEP